MATVEHDLSGEQARVLDLNPATLNVDVERILSRLLPTASASDQLEIGGAARRVLESVTRGEGRIRLDDLRHRVRIVNGHARERVSQAEGAARLLQAVAHAGPEAEGIWRDLADVLAGRRTLDDALNARAVETADELRRRADQDYIVRAVQESLEGLGFAQDAGFQTAEPKNGVLQVSRGGWLAHGVRMMIDNDRHELRAVVVRTATSAGWDESRADREHEEQWCQALPQLGELLEAKGVNYRVQELVEPGRRPTPLVAPSAAEEPRAAGRGRERSR